MSCHSAPNPVTKRELVRQSVHVFSRARYHPISAAEHAKPGAGTICSEEEALCTVQVNPPRATLSPSTSSSTF